jgi:hypothetical protein
MQEMLPVGAFARRRDVPIMDAFFLSPFLPFILFILLSFIAFSSRGYSGDTALAW